MAAETTDKFSAGEQWLGYIYQARLALLQLLQLPENTAVFLEKDDDLDFVDSDGRKSLASLKHKADGDRLTDLSIDFWKSIRIWLARYKRDGRSASSLRFFLFTTSTVSDTSFLKGFLPTQAGKGDETLTLPEQAENALSGSKSDLIGDIAVKFNELTPTEKQDFLARILILDGSPRIEDIPEAIKDRHMRSIRREHRNSVLERLEGWWNDAVIKQLAGGMDEGIFGYEVSDKLSALSEEYKLDNLPITFRGKEPAGEVDTEDDPRTFVVQLREIGISSSRIADSVPHYQRATALTGPIEIPFTDGLLDLGDEWSQAFKKFQPEGSLLPNTSVISKWVWNPNTPGAVSLESSAFRAKRSGSFEGITTPAPIALT
jgi:hypothetical protein